MYQHKKLNSLNDYFDGMGARREKGVYFYRLNGYTEEIGAFIRTYYEAARKTGVVIEGKIPNPDEKNLSYYEEIMGMDFQLRQEFIDESLKKWLPRMKEIQRKSVAASMYASLDSMRKDGKTENMQKNAYIKFMCWLYYKFERVANRLGEDGVPKILYEGTIGKYELMLISVLSNAGCDVVLLQYGGDEEYRKEDPQSLLSDALQMDGMKPFPPGYGLGKVRDEIQGELARERLYGARPLLFNCTNAWISGKGLCDVKESVAARGDDPGLFYNCFIRINGADDKVTYANELYQLQLELKQEKRKVAIASGEIAKPSADEIAGIRRGSYRKLDDMIAGLSANLSNMADAELLKLMRKAFVDAVLKEAEGGDGLNKLTGKAVYLLCWLKRYAPLLFSGWKAPEIACFIYLGGCRNESESMFLKFLARLPADVLILCPNRNVKCVLADDLLYEVNYEESLVLEQYPQEGSPAGIETAACHAERELDGLLYRDSGMYRNRQFAKANVISLRTMYEEIRILWDQELKYRPNFSTAGGVPNIPVIFAKVSGVKDGLLPQYWLSIKELMTEDAVVVKEAPYIDPNARNPMKAVSAGFYKNGRLLKDKIKNHPQYPYGILREDMQEFMLDRLQALIDQKLVKGIGENGTEYLAIATVLNLPQAIVRMIQKFDFTKKNPKLIYIHTKETAVPPEDSVLTAYLNQIGFDIIFFVPTGYRSAEKNFNKAVMEEHQIGEYMYDVTVPDFSRLSPRRARPAWRDRLFKRGN